MSVLDYNTAEVGTPQSDLIPDKTIAPVVMIVRGEKKTKAGDGTYLDCEFTITEGPFARRKFWDIFMITGKGLDITRSKVRGMIESAYGVSPTDESESAMTARQLSDWQDLDGLEFLACVKLEKSKDPQYKDKNRLSYAVTPDASDYEGFKPAKPKTSKAPSQPTQAASNGAGRPAWAS